MALSIPDASNALQQQKLYESIGDPRIVSGTLAKAWAPRKEVTEFGVGVGCHGALFDERKILNHLIECAPQYLHNASERQVSSSSFEEFVEKQSQTLGGSASGGGFGFSASVSVMQACSSSESRSSEAYYFNHTVAYNVAKVANASQSSLRGFLLPAARALLDNGPCKAVWQQLGSHFMMNATFGARASYSTVTAKAAYSNQSQANSTFRAAISTPWCSGSADTSSSSSTKAVGSHSKMSVRQDVWGGQPYLWMTRKRNEWHASACKSPVVVDADLLPIYHLAGTQERQTELKAFFESNFRREHDNALKVARTWPRDPSAVQKLQVYLPAPLRNTKGIETRSVVVIYRKINKPPYYRAVRDTPNQIAFHYAGNGAGQEVKNYARLANDPDRQVATMVEFSANHLKGKVRIGETYCIGVWDYPHWQNAVRFRTFKPNDAVTEIIL